jgi:hypothetical protein
LESHSIGTDADQIIRQPRQSPLVGFGSQLPVSRRDAAPRKPRPEGRPVGSSLCHTKHRPQSRPWLHLARAEARIAPDLDVERWVGCGARRHVP